MIYLFTQAGFIFRSNEKEIVLEDPLEQIQFEHIIFPLAVLCVFHVAAFVTVIYQLGMSLCKYGEGLCKYGEGSNIISPPS